jgi:hypothetical protein
MPLCYLILNAAAAMQALAAGMLLLLYVVFIPIITILEGWLFHRAGYNPSRKICNWHSFFLNLISVSLFCLLLAVEPPKEQFHWFFIRLLSIMILPFLGEFLFIRFMNQSFSKSLAKKFLFRRMGLKVFYLIVIYFLVYFPVNR